MSEDLLSLGEAYPKELARVREVLKVYEEIPAGRFAVIMISDLLRRAEAAIARGDTVAMIELYQ